MIKWEKEKKMLLHIFFVLAAQDKCFNLMKNILWGLAHIVLLLHNDHSKTIIIILEFMITNISFKIFLIGFYMVIIFKIFRKFWEFTFFRSKRVQIIMTNYDNVYLLISKFWVIK